MTFIQNRKMLDNP